MFKRYYLFCDKKNTGVLLSDLKQLKHKTAMKNTILLIFKKRSSLFLNYEDDDKMKKDWQFLTKLEKARKWVITITIHFIIFAIILLITFVKIFK